MGSGYMRDRQRRREDARVWLDYARGDLLTAQRAMADPAVEEAALFHCQQTAEKALKAYLIVAGASDLPRTHLLRNLVRMLDELGAATPSPEAVRFLDVHGVSVRYPGTPRPDAETVAVALQHARHVLDFVQAQLEFLDHTHGQPATNDPGPGEDDPAD